MIRKAAVSALVGALLPLIFLLSPVTAQTASPASKPSAPETAKREFIVAPTRPGHYSVWTVGKAGGSAPVTIAPDRLSARLTLPPGTQQIVVANETEGTVAMLLTEKLISGVTVPVTPQDFSRIGHLIVKVTAGGGKPVKTALVALKDATGKTAQKPLSAQDTGEAQFDNVPLGKATITATAGSDGLKTTQEVTIAPAPGGKPLTLTVPISGDAPTLDATSSGSGPPALPDAPKTEPHSSDWLSGVIGIAVLGAGGWFGLRALRTRGTTVAGTLRKIGVELPQDAMANGINPLKPTAAAPVLVPLPSLADLPAAGPSPVTAPASLATAVSAGAPRLVGLAGPVAGTVIPLESGTPVTIGRDTVNTLPLPQDTTVSRRHARIEGSGGSFSVIDEGSSNGTYVNGLRTPSQTLRPGDEIQIGAARFRFEG